MVKSQMPLSHHENSSPLNILNFSCHGKSHWWLS